MGVMFCQGGVPVFACALGGPFGAGRVRQTKLAHGSKLLVEATRTARSRDIGGAMLRIVAAFLAIPIASAVASSSVVLLPCGAIAVSIPRSAFARLSDSASWQSLTVLRAPSDFHAC